MPVHIIYTNFAFILQEVLAKYENKLSSLHRARLGDTATPLSPCLRAKKNTDEAGSSGKSHFIHLQLVLYLQVLFNYT